MTPENAADYLQAGSVGLGAGSTLVLKEALQLRDFAAITRRAEEFVTAVKAARSAGGR